MEGGGAKQREGKGKGREWEAKGAGAGAGGVSVSVSGSEREGVGQRSRASHGYARPVKGWAGQSRGGVEPHELHGAGVASVVRRYPDNGSTGS